LTNYEKGARFERKIKKILEAKGFFVTRSAGSKGPVDLLAVIRDVMPTSEDPRTVRFVPWVLFIQVKTGIINCHEVAALTDLARKYGATPVFARRRIRAGYIQFIDLRTMREMSI